MINLKDIEEARILIEDKIYKTPIITNEVINSKTKNKVFLKLENLQKTGFFKIRGVFNKLSSLQSKVKGIICATSGSHGLAVAYACSFFGWKAKVIVPTNTPTFKINKLKELSDVEIVGDSYHESYLYAIQTSKKEGLTFIHGFDDPLVIAGQGTVGLEMAEEIEELDLMIVPVGGGGLLSGILIGIKSLHPRIKIIGVQAEGAASMYLSWKKGSIVELEQVNTIAEGVAVKKPGELTFEIINKLVDDIVIVSDEDIKESMKILFYEAKVIAEGAGAISLAPLLCEKISVRNKKIGCIISGGNISGSSLCNLLQNFTS